MGYFYLAMGISLVILGIRVIVPPRLEFQEPLFIAHGSELSVHYRTANGEEVEQHFTVVNGHITLKETRGPQ